MISNHPDFLKTIKIGYLDDLPDDFYKKPAVPKSWEVGEWSIDTLSASR